MSTLKSMALKIPDRIRSERLMIESDPIANAYAVPNDKNMQMLSKIWYSYIAINDTPSDCPICLNNILSSFRNLKPSLIEIETEYQKIQSL